MISIRIYQAQLFAKISLILLIFFTFFPTSIPFQSTLQELGADEISQANPINQLIRLAIFFFSLIASLSKTKEIAKIIFEEKFVAIFLLWCLITMLWAEYPVVSFKRWFQIFIFYFSTIVFLSYYPNPEKIITILKPVLILYILSTLIVVLLIPAAKDPRFYTWRGLSPHKNHLGQLALLSILGMYLVNFYEKVRLKKYVNLILTLFAIIILLGAYSSTSILAFLLFLSYTTVFYLNKQFNRFIKVSRALNLFFLLFSFTLILILYFGFKENIESLGLFGKDVTTLSDRTYLWEYILVEISKHPIIGYGFRSFWVVDSPLIQQLWNVFPFLPIQSHNGYLDIINETGIIGLLILIFIVFSFYIKLLKVPEAWKWSWFFSLPLFINISESTLFKEGHSTFIFFIISYLVVNNIYQQKMKRNLNEHGLEYLA